MSYDPIFQCIPVPTSALLPISSVKSVHWHIERGIVRPTHNSLTKSVIAMIEVANSMSVVLNRFSIHEVGNSFSYGHLKSVNEMFVG